MRRRGTARHIHPHNERRAASNSRVETAGRSAAAAHSCPGWASAISRPSEASSPFACSRLTPGASRPTARSQALPTRRPLHRIESQRHPELFPDREPEALRHDPGDRGLHTANEDGPSDNRRVGAELQAPGVVADDDDRSRLIDSSEGNRSGRGAVDVPARTKAAGLISAIGMGSGGAFGATRLRCTTRNAPRCSIVFTCPRQAAKACRTRSSALAVAWMHIGSRRSARRWAAADPRGGAR